MDQIDEMVEQALVDIGQLDEDGADAHQVLDDERYQSDGGRPWTGEHADEDDEDDIAYAAYVAECEEENLEAHPWGMWVLYGKPKSIWAAL